MKSLRVSIVLLFTLCTGVFSGLAQSGGPSDPPPPNHLSKPMAPSSDNWASVSLEGTLIIRNFDLAADGPIGFVRKIGQALLQTDRLSVVYPLDETDARIQQLADGEIAARTVQYQKISLDAVTESLLNRVGDFLITDGKKYFQIKLEPVKTGKPINIGLKMIEEGL